MALRYLSEKQILELRNHTPHPDLKLKAKDMSPVALEIDFINTALDLYGEGIAGEQHPHYLRVLNLFPEQVDIYEFIIFKMKEDSKSQKSESVQKGIPSWLHTINNIYKADWAFFGTIICLSHTTGMSMTRALDSVVKLMESNNLSLVDAANKIEPFKSDQGGLLSYADWAANRFYKPLGYDSVEKLKIELGIE